jgi:hypothetical protein
VQLIFHSLSELREFIECVDSSKLPVNDHLKMAEAAKAMIVAQSEAIRTEQTPTEQPPQPAPSQTETKGQVQPNMTDLNLTKGLDWEGAIATIAEPAPTVETPPPSPAAAPPAQTQSSDPSAFRALMSAAVQATDIAKVMSTIHSVAGVHRSEDIPPGRIAEISQLLRDMIKGAAESASSAEIPPVQDY